MHPKENGNHAAVRGACLLIGLLVFIGMNGLARAENTVEPAVMTPKEIAVFRNARDEWYHKTLVEAYLDQGSRNEKWDEFAVPALENFAVYMSRSADRRGDELIQAQEFSQKAIKQECNDPLVVFVHAYTTDTLSVKGEVYCHRYYKQADTLFPKYSYSPAWQLMAFNKVLDYFTEAGAFKASEYISRRSQEVARAQILEKDVPGSLWFSLFEEMISNYPDKIGFGPIWSTFPSIMKKQGAPETNTRCFEGLFYLEWAWRARGHSTIDQVEKEGYRQYRERLQKARRAFDKAWELDPTNVAAALGGLGAQLDNKGDFETMERWFQRAIRLNPDNYRACTCKRIWLMPRWHGQPADGFEFGLECVATGNYAGEIPLVMIDILLNYSAFQDGKYYKYAQPKFFHNPEVWRIAHDVFMNYLEKYPTDSIKRSRLIRVAVLAEKYEVANYHMGILEGKVAPNAWPTKFVMADTLEQLKKHNETGKEETQ